MRVDDDSSDRGKCISRAKQRSALQDANYRASSGRNLGDYSLDNMSADYWKWTDMLQHALQAARATVNAAQLRRKRRRTAGAL